LPPFFAGNVDGCGKCGWCKQRYCAGHHRYCVSIKHGFSPRVCSGLQGVTQFSFQNYEHVSNFCGKGTNRGSPATE